MNELSENLGKVVRPHILAQKHNVSEQYVRMILSGKRATNTAKAQAIMDDAKRVAGALEKSQDL